MASDETFVTFVCDQAGRFSPVSYRKMFGEYAVYCRGKVVAFVCNNQLFVKPTPGGRAALSELVEGAPYPGARLHFLIADRLDDGEWLSQLMDTTAVELPAPKPKAAKKPGKRNKAGERNKPGEPNQPGEPTRSAKPKLP